MKIDNLYMIPTNFEHAVLHCDSNPFVYRFDSNIENMNFTHLLLNKANIIYDYLP